MEPKECCNTDFYQFEAIQTNASEKWWWNIWGKLMTWCQILVQELKCSIFDFKRGESGRCCCSWLKCSEPQQEHEVRLESLIQNHRNLQEHIHKIYWRSNGNSAHHTIHQNTVFHRAQNTHLEPCFPFYVQNRPAVKVLSRLHPLFPETKTPPQVWSTYTSASGTRPPQQQYSLLLTVCLLFQTHHYLKSNISLFPNSRAHTHTHTQLILCWQDT